MPDDMLTLSLDLAVDGMQTQVACKSWRRCLTRYLP